MKTNRLGIAAIAFAAGLIAAPKLSTADVTLTGDFFVIGGNAPCCINTENLFVGTQRAPASGSLVVNGGSNLSQYYTMIFGIFEKTALGDMTVIESSSVSIGSDLAVGSTGRGNLFVGGASTVNVLGGPLAFGTTGAAGCFSVGTFAGSNGTAVLTDPGTALNAPACIVIGGGGNDPSGFGNAGLPGRGSLDILNGASATTLFYSGGLRGTGVATVNIVDGALNILGTEDGGFGSFMTVARSASGVMTADNSNILIDPQAAIPSFDFGAGFNVNREETGDGELNLSNGSTLLVKGAFGFGGIGRRGGNSEVNISGGSSMIIEDQSTGAVWVSPEAGSTAKIKLDGAGSTLDAGSLLALGVDFDETTPGGSCTLNIGAGAIVRAVTILVGPNCRIKGKGTIEGDVIADPGAKISKKITIVP